MKSVPILKRTLIEEIDPCTVRVIIPGAHVLNPRSTFWLDRLYKIKENIGLQIVAVSWPIYVMGRDNPHVYGEIGLADKRLTMYTGETPCPLMVDHANGETLHDVILREYQSAYRKAKRST